MPRLGSLLVCEKLILDQQGKPSLISLFQKITALVPEGQEIPKAALAMTNWTVFCEWFFTEDELSKTYVHFLEVLHPDGTPSPIRANMPLKELAKHGQGSRAFVNIVGMPVAQKGFITINVWLECDSRRVSDVGSYEIEIEHSSEPPVPSDSGSTAFAIVPPQHSN
jgi:hypothetical protein